MSDKRVEERVELFSEIVKRLGVEKGKVDFESVAYDKRLAKLGDAFLNYMNVLAVVAGYLPKDSKVTNKLLRSILNDSELRKLTRRRQNARELGNIVEALVAFTVLNSIVSEEEILAKISRERNFAKVIADILKISAAELLSYSNGKC